MGTHIKNMYIYIPQIYTSIYIYTYTHIYIYIYTMHVGPSSPTCALRLLFLQIHVQYIKDFAPVPVHVAVTCFPFRRVPVDSPVAAQPQPPVKCSVALIIMFRVQFCNSGSGIIATPFCVCKEGQGEPSCFVFPCAHSKASLPLLFVFARRVKVNSPFFGCHVHTLRVWHFQV